MNSDTKSTKRPIGRLLMFPSSPAPARYEKRDGYGRPITHIFGLPISGAVAPTRRFTLCGSGAMVEVLDDTRKRGRA